MRFFRRDLFFFLLRNTALPETVRTLLQGERVSLSGFVHRDKGDRSSQEISSGHPRPSLLCFHREAENNRREIRDRALRRELAGERKGKETCFFQFTIFPSKFGSRNQEHIVDILRIIIPMT